MSQTLLADYAVPLDPRDVQAAGYIGVLRYIAPPDAKYDWKRFTAHERDTIFTQSNLGVLLVFESYAGRALAGAAAGTADANTTIQAAQALGCPSDVPLFLACDTDATADQVRPYFQAAAQVSANIGVYGGIKVVDPLLADGTVRWGWQTCAWSGQTVSQTAHLYQRLRPTTALKGSFDEDVQLRPIPLWTAPSAVVAPPTPAPDPAPTAAPNPTPAQPAPQRTGARPMGAYIIRVTDGPLKDAEFYDYGNGPVHIDGPESIELTAAPNPIPVKPLSGALFAKRFPGVQ